MQCFNFAFLSTSHKQRAKNVPIPFLKPVMIYVIFVTLSMTLDRRIVFIFFRVRVTIFGFVRESSESEVRFVCPQSSSILIGSERSCVFTRKHDLLHDDACHGIKILSRGIL